MRRKTGRKRGWAGEATGGMVHESLKFQTTGLGLDLTGEGWRQTKPVGPIPLARQYGMAWVWAYVGVYSSSIMMRLGARIDSWEGRVAGLVIIIGPRLTPASSSNAGIDTAIPGREARPLLLSQCPPILRRPSVTGACAPVCSAPPHERLFQENLRLDCADGRRSQSFGADQICTRHLVASTHIASTLWTLN